MFNEPEEKKDWSFMSYVEGARVTQSLRKKCSNFRKNCILTQL